MSVTTEECYYFHNYGTAYPEDPPPFEVQVGGLGGSWRSPDIGGSGVWEEHPAFETRFPYPYWEFPQQFLICKRWVIVYRHADNGTLYVHETGDGMDRLFRVDNLQGVANIVNSIAYGSWDEELAVALGEKEPENTIMVTHEQLANNLVKIMREGRFEVHPFAPDFFWEQ
jgi:hypothetical protein